MLITGAESTSRVDQRRQPSESPDSNDPWHVLHTKARQEKALAQTLGAAGLEHYLPTIERATYHGRRRQVVVAPLFPSYVFLRGPLDATYFAVRTRRVANVIPVVDQARFERELAQIRRVAEAGADLDPWEFLHTGRRVRVSAGPWKNLEGLVEDHPRPDRLVLQIDVLGQATSFEIDAGLLEPVD